MKSTITFEVTKDKTTVISTGSTGKVETLDITGTDVEKDFTKLLRKLSKHKLANQVIEAISMNTWKEF